MQVLVVYAACAVAPAAFFYGISHGLDRLTRWHGRPRSTSTTDPGLERLAGALRRLEHDYRRIQASDLPGRATRLRTVALAYDDTLLACCRALGLPQPAAAPLAPLTRLQTEAALAQSGLTW